MDDRLKVALGATLIAAIFAFGAGGNWLVFLVLASMAVLVTWDFGSTSIRLGVQQIACCTPAESAAEPVPVWLLLAQLV